MAPMDMDGILQRAMKSQPGSTQLAFHWTNYDFRSKFEGNAARAAKHSHANARIGMTSMPLLLVCCPRCRILLE